MPLLDNETQISILVDGLDHPEGIAWGLDGYAYAGGEAGQVYRIDIESKAFSQFADTGGFVLGMALDASHNIYAVDVGNRCVQKITPEGVVSVYSTGAVGEPMRTPNYPAFDSEGNLYVADSGDWRGDNGLIFKIAPGGEGEVWTRDAKTFPNGLCLGPGDEHLYVVMSLNPPRVDRIKIEPDGSAGPIETVVELPMTVPDGVAFDTDGYLYASMYRPDRIYRLSPSGQLDILAEDFEGTLIACPTNISFCGRDRDVLLSANLGRWHISRYEAEATGLPLHYPDLG
jgi:gluconolactonase